LKPDDIYYAAELKYGVVSNNNYN